MFQELALFSKILSIIEESKEKSARMTQLCFSLYHRNRMTKAHVKELTLQRTLRLSILNISVKIAGLSIDVLSSANENISDKRLFAICL